MPTTRLQQGLVQQQQQQQQQASQQQQTPQQQQQHAQNHGQPSKTGLHHNRLTSSVSLGQFSTPPHPSHVTAYPTPQSVEHSSRHGQGHGHSHGHGHGHGHSDSAGAGGAASSQADLPPALTDPMGGAKGGGLSTGSSGAPPRGSAAWAGMGDVGYMQPGLYGSHGHGHGHGQDGQGQGHASQPPQPPPHSFTSYTNHHPSRSVSSPQFLDGDQSQGPSQASSQGSASLADISQNYNHNQDDSQGSSTFSIPAERQLDIGTGAGGQLSSSETTSRSRQIALTHSFDGTMPAPPPGQSRFAPIDRRDAVSDGPGQTLNGTSPCGPEDRGMTSTPAGGSRHKSVRSLDARTAHADLSMESPFQPGTTHRHLQGSPTPAQRGNNAQVAGAGANDAMRPFASHRSTPSLGQAGATLSGGRGPLRVAGPSSPLDAGAAYDRPASAGYRASNQMGAQMPPSSIGQMTTGYGPLVGHSSTSATQSARSSSPSGSTASTSLTSVSGQPGHSSFSPYTSKFTGDLSFGSQDASTDSVSNSAASNSASRASSTSDELMSQNELGLIPGVMRLTKRKTKLLNIDRKRICDYHVANPKHRQDDIAALFGIERSTVSKILKQKDKWLAIEPESDVARIAKHRSAKFPQVEQKLSEWAVQLKTDGKVLHDVTIKSKALQFARELGLGVEKFKASGGWIEKFRERNGIPKVHPADGVDPDSPEGPSAGVLGADELAMSQVSAGTSAGEVNGLGIHCADQSVDVAMNAVAASGEQQQHHQTSRLGDASHGSGQQQSGLAVGMDAEMEVDNANVVHGQPGSVAEHAASDRVENPITSSQTTPTSAHKRHYDAMADQVSPLDNGMARMQFGSSDVFTPRRPGVMSHQLGRNAGMPSVADPYENSRPSGMVAKRRREDGPDYSGQGGRVPLGPAFEEHDAVSPRSGGPGPVSLDPPMTPVQNHTRRLRSEVESQQVQRQLSPAHPQGFYLPSQGHATLHPHSLMTPARCQPYQMREHDGAVGHHPQSMAESNRLDEDSMLEVMSSTAASADAMGTAAGEKAAHAMRSLQTSFRHSQAQAQAQAQTQGQGPGQPGTSTPRQSPRRSPRHVHVHPTGRSTSSSSRRAASPALALALSPNAGPSTSSEMADGEDGQIVTVEQARQSLELVLRFLSEQPDGFCPANHYIVFGNLQGTLEQVIRDKATAGRARPDNGGSRRE